MKKWNKNNALKAIQKLVDQIPDIKISGRRSKEHVRWLANSLRLIEEIFGKRSRYYKSLSNFSWQVTGQMFIQSYDIEGTISRKHDNAFISQMDQACGLLLAAQDQLNDSNIEDVYAGKDISDETSEFIKIINLGSNKLRKIIRETPSKEKDIQDKYEELLIANDIEYSREFPHIKYSSKQYIPDFSFQKIDLAIEIKFCQRNEKDLIAQLNDDILAYQTVFSNILFIIYDLGQIRDEDIFKASFEKYSKVIIQIIKH